MLSLLFYLYCVVICTIFTLLSAIAFVVCYPFDRKRWVVHNLSRLLVRCFFMVPPRWRYRVEGLEKIDPKKSYVIVSNHNTLFDILAMYFIPMDFRWVSKREVVKAPFFGQLLFLHGDILINRGRAAQALEQLLREGKMWTDRGVSVAIFPEGTRSKTGQMGSFKPGGFMLAKEAGVEMLPIVLEGTRTFFKPGSWMWSWRNTLKLRVLDSISVEELHTGKLSAVVDRTRERMLAAVEEMRNETK